MQLEKEASVNAVPDTYMHDGRMHELYRESITLAMQPTTATD